MTFLDTGIMVGAVLQSHPEHEACLSALEDSERPFTNGHVLAETFATDYETSIREARSRGVMGGGIYDSLHATFARRKKAVGIVTRNPSHFQQWPRISRFLLPELESHRGRSKR